jgi:DNA-binding XRE family transcriptional regulator
MGKPSVTTKPTSAMEWLETELAKDPGFRQAVEEELNRMRIEQDLAALRELRGISQAELAKLLGVSQAVIGRIESGRAQNIGLKTLVRIAVAMGGRVHVSIKADGHQRPVRKSALALVARPRKVAKASG